MATLRHILFMHFQARIDGLLPSAPSPRGNYQKQEQEGRAQHSISSSNKKEKERIHASPSTSTSTCLPGHVELEKVIGSNTLVISAKTKLAIAHAARRNGVIAGQALLDSGARLWSLMMNRNNSLLILSGNSGCGKTTLREVVLSTIRTLGAPRETLHAGGDSLHSLRSMEKVGAPIAIRDRINPCRGYINPYRVYINPQSSPFSFSFSFLPSSLPCPYCPSCLANI